MVKPTSADLATAARQLVAERNRLRELLAQVAESVLDRSPDGMSVAYLPAHLLDEIRRLTN